LHDRATCTTFSNGGIFMLGFAAAGVVKASNPAKFLTVTL
jgi:hypothetical protein